jgi:hypothetical protein
MIPLASKGIQGVVEVAVSELSRKRRGMRSRGIVFLISVV